MADHTLKSFELYEERLGLSLNLTKEFADKIDSPHGKLLVKTIRAVFQGVRDEHFAFDTSSEKSIRSLFREHEPNQLLDEKVNSVIYWTETYLEYLDEMGVVWSLWQKAAIRMIEVLLFYYKKNVLHATMIKILFTSMNENVLQYAQKN